MELAKSLTRLAYRSKPSTLLCDNDCFTRDVTGVTVNHEQRGGGAAKRAFSTASLFISVFLSAVCEGVCNMASPPGTLSILCHDFTVFMSASAQSNPTPHTPEGLRNRVGQQQQSTNVRNLPVNASEFMILIGRLYRVSGLRILQRRH